MPDNLRFLIQRADGCPDPVAIFQQPENTIAGEEAAILDVKISGNDTNGALVLFEQTSLSWTQVSDTGKLVVTFQPAGKMENFFVTVAALQTEPTLQEMAKLFADNDMQIVGPTLKVE